VASILGALRRVVGGRGERTRIARKVRALVLGPPALDDAACTQRLLAAGTELGLDIDAIRELLWIDLANERPVALPDGRPSGRRLAAYANLDRIQRAVRSAHELRLRIDGEAHELIRTAARWGLVTTISRDGTATVLDVLGPLSLFHATSVYGRALAALVPQLAEHPRFMLTMACDFGHGPAMLRLAPPALLPPASEARTRPSVAVRLARQLAKAGADVTLDPPPIAHGASLLYPELAIRNGGRTWLVELVGFATADHVAAKLARYASAGVTDVVLCVDEDRAPGTAADPRVLAYDGKLTADSLRDFLARPS
jgi:predicted nuclease of restriction endonuclease-like RecB superfamily